MKILVYLYEGMADFEITLLLHRLRKQGKIIVSASESIKLLTAQSGLRYLPDKCLDDIKDVKEFEAMIIPGGPINNEQNSVCGILKEADKENKLIAAICFAPQFLARAGLLDNRKFTTSCSLESIKKTGDQDPFPRQNFVDENVVCSGNIITAKGTAFVEFADSVCEYLKKS